MVPMDTPGSLLSSVLCFPSNKCLTWELWEFLNIMLLSMQGKGPSLESFKVGT